MSLPGSSIDAGGNNNGLTLNVSAVNEYTANNPNSSTMMTSNASTPIINNNNNQGYGEKKGRFKVTNVSAATTNNESESFASDSKNSVGAAKSFDTASAPKSEKIMSTVTPEEKPTYDGSKISQQSEDISKDSKAPPKKGRFTVKTVTKKDDDNGMGEGISPSTGSPNQNSQNISNTGGESIIPNNHSQPQLTSNDIYSMFQRFEQLIELNTQVLSSLLGSPEKHHSSHHNQNGYLLNHLSSANTINSTLNSSPSYQLLSDQVSLPSQRTLSLSSTSHDSESVSVKSTAPTSGLPQSASMTIQSSASKDKIESYPSVPPLPPQSISQYIIPSDLQTIDDKSSLKDKNTSSLPSTGNQNSAGQASPFVSDKDKGFTKLFHYISEMKKELEIVQKQKKDSALESHRLREKCQQLEEKNATESSRILSLEDRVEKGKTLNRTLQQQIDQQAQKIETQNLLIEQQNQVIHNLKYMLQQQGQLANIPVINPVENASNTVVQQQLSLQPPQSLPKPSSGNNMSQVASGVSSHVSSPNSSQKASPVVPTTSNDILPAPYIPASSGSSIPLVPAGHQNPNASNNNDSSKVAGTSSHQSKIFVAGPGNVTNNSGTYLHGGSLAGNVPSINMAYGQGTTHSYPMGGHISHVVYPASTQQQQQQQQQNLLPPMQNIPQVPIHTPAVPFTPSQPPIALPQPVYNHAQVNLQTQSQSQPIIQQNQAIFLPQPFDNFPTVPNMALNMNGNGSMPTAIAASVPNPPIGKGLTPLTGSTASMADGNTSNTSNSISSIGSLPYPNP